MDPVPAAIGDTLAKGDDRRVKSKLEDGVDPLAGRRLHFGQTVDVPRIEYQRLLANRVGIGPQRKPDMGIVQVVGRTDTHVLDALA